MKNLTSKKLQLARKEGKTISDLTLEYGFESEEKFLEVLSRLYSNKRDFNAMRDALRANEKIRKRQSPKNQIITAIENCDAVTSTEDTEETQEEETFVEVTSPIQIEPSISQKPSKKAVYESLQREEKECSDKIVAREIRHNELIALHRQKRETLMSLNDDLSKLSEIYKEKKALVIQTIKETVDISQEMSVLTEENRVDKVHLSELRERMKSMQSITVCVYADGQIDIDSVDISINEICAGIDFGANALSILQSEKAMELNISVKEVYTIAKLRHIIEHLTQSGQTYEVLYDNINVQLYFEYDQLSA